MDVRTLCLGVLSLGETSGYGIRKSIDELFGHFAQASLGAIYPALAKLTAAGEVETIGAADAPLDKRLFRITTLGRARLRERVSDFDGEEITRSPFIAGLFFAELLEMDDVFRLMDERLAGLRSEQRRLRNLPLARMSEGQRFGVRYALTVTAAKIEFLEAEGRAIVNAIGRQRSDG